MKRANLFMREILVGGGIAVVAAIVFSVISFGSSYGGGYPISLHYFGFEAKVTATIVSILYSWHIASLASTKRGWVLVAVGFADCTFLSFAGTAPAVIHLLSQVLWGWLLRSIYLGRGFANSILDGTVILFAMIWSAWVYFISDSVLISTWAFFMAQAVYVYTPEIKLTAEGTPRTFGAGIDKTTTEDRKQSEDRFAHSFQAAEAALRELASRG